MKMRIINLIWLGLLYWTAIGCGGQLRTLKMRCTFFFLLYFGLLLFFLLLLLSSFIKWLIFTKIHLLGRFWVTVHSCTVIVSSNCCFTRVVGRAQWVLCVFFVTLLLWMIEIFLRWNLLPTSWNLLFKQVE